jgi:hypothetical protein
MTDVSLDLHQWPFVARLFSLPFRLSGRNRTVSMTWGLVKNDLRTTNDLCNLISNSPHTLANRMRGLQILCNAHPRLLMCQFV